MHVKNGSLREEFGDISTCSRDIWLQGMLANLY